MEGARDDPLLQLRGRLVGEGEGNDVTRPKRVGFPRREQVDDPSSNDFRLAGTRAGDQLKIAAVVLDRALLRFGKSSISTELAAPANNQSHPHVSRMGSFAPTFPRIKTIRDSRRPALTRLGHVRSALTPRLPSRRSKAGASKGILKRPGCAKRRVCENGGC